MLKDMTKSQILEAIRMMQTQERLEVIEFTSRLIREEMPQTDVKDRVTPLSLVDAAEIARPYYEEGSELTEFSDLCQEDFYEYHAFSAEKVLTNMLEQHRQREQH